LSGKAKIRNCGTPTARIFNAAWRKIRRKMNVER